MKLKYINNLSIDKDLGVGDLSVIKLTIKQFLYFGIHIGHLKKNSQFLCAWLFYGWRKNVFIINLIKTVFLTKVGLRMVKNVIRLNLSFWFVSMNKIYGTYLARYASLCGEPFNIYCWISGSLCNYRYVYGWNFALENLYKKKLYKVRHMDKKKLLGNSGLHSLVKYTWDDEKKWVDIEGINSLEFQKLLELSANNKNVNYKRFINLKGLNKSWKFMPKIDNFYHQYIMDRVIKFVRKNFFKRDYKYIEKGDFIKIVNKLKKKELSRLKLIEIIKSLVKKRKYINYKSDFVTHNKKDKIDLKKFYSFGYLNYKFLDFFSLKHSNYIYVKYDRIWYNRILKKNINFFFKRNKFLIRSWSKGKINDDDFYKLFRNIRRDFIFLKDSKLRYKLTSVLLEVEKRTKLKKKLLLLKILDKPLYRKIIVNFNYLFSIIDWHKLTKSTYKAGYLFLKEYLDLKLSLFIYYTKKINFNHLDYLLKVHKLIGKNNFDIFDKFKNILGVNKNYLVKDKIKILNFIFNMKNIKNDEERIDAFNNFIEDFNHEKKKQIDIVLNIIKTSKNRKKFIDFLENLDLFNNFKKKSKVVLKFNSLRIKKNFINNYYFKRIEGKKLLEKKKEANEFFKYFFFKKEFKKILLFRAVNKRDKWDFLNMRSDRILNMPGGGFVPTVLDNPNVIDEFALSRTPFLTLIDSNVRSLGVYIPVPSNDDSIQCVNFFSFLISKAILINKFFFLQRFITNIKKSDSSLNFNINYKFIFLSFLKEKIRGKEDFNLNETSSDFNKFLLLTLKAANVENFDFSDEIKINMFIEHEAIYSLMKNKMNFSNFKYYKV